MQEFADENLDLLHRDTVQIYGRLVLALESEGKSDIIRSTFRLRWEKLSIFFSQIVKIDLLGEFCTKQS